MADYCRPEHWVVKRKSVRRSGTNVIKIENDTERGECYENIRSTLKSGP